MDNKVSNNRHPVIDLKPFIEDEKILKTYANGSIVQASGSDVLIVLQTNGKATEILNMSLPMAKGLSEHLSKMIKVLESKGVLVQSPEEIMTLLAKK